MIKTYIVDDEQLIIDELMSMMDWESLGYTICGYENDSKKALEEINEKLPSMIICDITMGGMNGIELIEKVMKRNPETGVIFLTAYDNFEYAIEAINLHVLAYLMKPVKIEELKNVLISFKKKKFLSVFYRFMEMILKNDFDENIINSTADAINEYGLFKDDKEYAFGVCGSDINSFEGVAKCSYNGRTMYFSSKENFIENNVEECGCDVVYFKGYDHLYRICKDLLKNYEERILAENKESDIEVVLKQIVEDIGINYGRKLSLIYYSEKYHYNISYLSEQFKCYIGVNFIDYLMKTRFEKAKELMRNSKLSLNEIAEMIGYDDYSHFSKLFKKHENCTPVEYRKFFC